MWAMMPRILLAITVVAGIGLVAALPALMSAGGEKEGSAVQLKDDDRRGRERGGPEGKPGKAKEKKAGGPSKVDSGQPPTPVPAPAPAPAPSPSPPAPEH